MMASTSTYGTSPFQPLPRPAAPQGCRGQTAPDSTGLTKAMSMVVIQDLRACEMSQDVSQSQDIPPASQWPPFFQAGLTQQPPRSFTHSDTVTRKLNLELSQTHSQELPIACTPDMATPGEAQHFLVDYESNAQMGLEDESSRSPAPSPRRHIKRPRPILDAESDSQLSQPSQSQSRSQGDPSTCSKTALGFGGGPGKPPMHPRHPNGSVRKRKHEPPVIRNPYLTPGTDNNHIYHAANYNFTMAALQQRLFWDFKQEERLGAGNFSEVYCVIHRQSGKRYALKKSRRPVATLQEKNMWLAEVQAMAAVEGHPNVVQFYDSWVEPVDPHGSGEWFFIRMELCGSSLRAQPVLPAAGTGATQAGPSQAPGAGGPKAGAGGVGSQGGRHGPREAMKEADLLEVMRQMALALKHIHDRGLAHLDLKPDNIYRARPQAAALALLQSAPSMPQPSHSSSNSSATSASSQPMCSQPPAATQAASQQCGGSQMPASQQPAQPQQPPVVYKLGDFGLATAKNALAPYTEGDARYLAPELLSGRSEFGLDRADMFALGATLYELATGATLPTGGERYHALRQGQLMMMPCVSVRTQQLIKKLMSSDPKERPTADQLLRSPLLSNKGA